MSNDIKILYTAEATATVAKVMPAQAMVASTSTSTCRAT